MQCVRAFARMHVSPMTTAALYIINRVKASQPRDSKMSEGGGGEFAVLCAPACCYTRELIAAHRSHWSQMVVGCVCVGVCPVSLQELANLTT